MTLDADTGRGKEFLLVALCQCLCGQCVSGLGCPSEPIFPDGGILQSPAPEIGIAYRLAFRSIEAFLEKLFGIIQHQQEALAPLSRSNLFRSLLLFLYFNAIFSGQIFQGLDISHVLVLHDEADRRP